MVLGIFLVFLLLPGKSNELIDIHNTSDGTENGTYNENDIIKTLDIGDDATILNSEFDLSVEGFLKNIVLDKIPPAILLDNSVFSGINSFFISLSLFEKYGLSYRTIKISYCPDSIVDIDSSNYICLFDGPSTKTLENKYGEYLNNIKIENQSNNYNFSFILDSTIGNIAINGLKVEIYDYAGNGIIYYNDIPFTIIQDSNFIPVEITFSNISPENLYVSQTEVGKCLVSVYNPEFNKSLWGSKIVANLTNDSVGSIVTSTIQLSKLNPEDSRY